MKQFTFVLVFAGVLSLAFTNPVEVVDTYNVDTKASTINWTGRKVTGQHTGTISLSEGSLAFNANKLASAQLTVDMKTMATPDGDRLLGHLKGDDFFGVEKHPKATFVSTKIAPISTNSSSGNNYTITGNLTIKGITNPITFEAKIGIANSVIRGIATLKIDRSKYDIRYGSKSFFADIGDKAIDDIFELQVNLVAKK